MRTYKNKLLQILEPPGGETATVSGIWVLWIGTWDILHENTQSVRLNKVLSENQKGLGFLRILLWE